MSNKEPNPMESTIRSNARKFATNRHNRSAIDETRANEGKEFSKEAQDAFGANERGSEDVMDMFEKGSFD